MAIGASILRGEVRRHLLMNVGLVASCVVSATVVTNERGLFVPITADMSDTSRAFAAMFTQSRLLPDNEVTNVQMVTPLSPFEVTADSRDLRRRLMDALSSENDAPGGAGGVPGQQSEFAQNASQMPTLDNQVLSLNSSAPSTQTASSAGGAGGAAGSSGGGSSGGSQSSSGTTVASGTGNGTGSGSSSSSASNAGSGSSTSSNQSPITVASAASNPAQTQAASGVTDGTALSNSSDGVNLGGSTGSDQNATGPAAVPEPSIWAMLIAGFGMVGYLLRTANRKREDEAEAEAA